MNLVCETEKGWLRFLIFFIKMHLLGASPPHFSCFCNDAKVYSGEHTICSNLFYVRGF